MILLFDLTNPYLAKILEHTAAHKNTCRVPYSKDPAKPDTLWLVKDDGIYLMASTIEPIKDGKDRNLVVYAKGHGPEDEWIPGSDFVESVPAQEFRDAITAGRKTVELRLTSKSIFIL